MLSFEKCVTVNVSKSMNDDNQINQIYIQYTFKSRIIAVNRNSKANNNNNNNNNNCNCKARNVSNNTESEAPAVAR